MDNKARASFHREKRPVKSVVSTQQTGAKAKKPSVGRINRQRLGQGPTAADLKQVPPLSNEQLATARPLSEWKKEKERKQLISLRIDSDVLAWFRSTGNGYQARMNEALRRAYLAEVTS